jgi:hypothetical protein
MKNNYTMGYYVFIGGGDSQKDFSKLFERQFIAHFAALKRSHDMSKGGSCRNHSCDKILSSFKWTHCWNEMLSPAPKTYFSYLVANA